MYSNLIRGFLFWFSVTYPMCMWKSLEIVGAPWKKQRCCFFYWCTLCIAFLIYKLSRFLITGYCHSRWEVFSFWTFLVLDWKINKIAPFIEHLVYVIFKVEYVLILTGWFSFDTSYPRSMFKTYLFLNFECSTKEALIVFFSWSIIYVYYFQCAKFH